MILYLPTGSYPGCCLCVCLSFLLMLSLNIYHPVCHICSRNIRCSFIFGPWVIRGTCLCSCKHCLSPLYMAEMPYGWAQCGSSCVADCSANNTLLWGKLFKLFSSSNWPPEWGLYWVSTHCNILWGVLGQWRNPSYDLKFAIGRYHYVGNSSGGSGWRQRIILKNVLCMFPKRSIT